MAVRSSWKGSLGWGMVSCDVRVFKVEEVEAEFHMYHRECVEEWIAGGSKEGEKTGRVERKTTCGRCGNELLWRDAARGIEVGGSVVLLEGDELEGLKEEVEDYAEIVGFMKWRDVDLRGLSDCYYLSPVLPKAKKKMGLVIKAYRLIYEAMKGSGVCALVKIGYRGRWRLAVMQPYPRSEEVGDTGIMLLHWVLWKNKVRDYSVLVPAGDVGVLSADELNHAKGMIAANAVDFDKVWAGMKDERVDKIGDIVTKGMLKQATDAWEMMKG